MRRNAFHWHKAISLALLASLLLTTIALASEPLLVDHFDAFQQIVLVRTGPSSTPSEASQVADSSALGGYRDIFAQITSGSTGNFSVRTNYNNDSLFSHNLESGVRGISRITWDGNDDPGTLNPIGLQVGGVGVDLSNGGVHDVVLVGIEFDDLAVPLTLNFYTDADNWSTYTLNLPGAVFYPVAYEIPFSDFSTGGSGPADFNDIGAIEVEIDSSATPGLDLRLHFLETATAGENTDYGDLPDSYGITLSSENGAGHIAGQLFLGTVVDVEADGQPSVNSEGDDLNSFPDEDGVAPTPLVNWVSGPNGGSIDVTMPDSSVYNCSSNSCLFSGWIDFNNDLDFADAGETIFFNQAINNGVQTLTFDIPAGISPSNNRFNARFRLSENPLNAPGYLGTVSNGEVEDYAWFFGPTAVTLSSLTAQSNLTASAVITIVAAGLLLITLVFSLIEWRRRNQNSV